jgi:hypothetical protein
MPRALLRSLALSCGLLLTLPPGWCCLLAHLTQRPVAAGQPVNSKPACCGHCGAKQGDRSRQIPDHIPGREGKCPCGERTATAPGAPVNAGPDLLLLAPGTVTGLDTAARAVPACDPPASYSAPPHFHLLNCVWLC